MYNPREEFTYAMQRSREEAWAADRAASVVARRSHRRLSELHADKAAAIARRSVEIGIDGGRVRRSAVQVTPVNSISPDVGALCST